ncbi:MAG: hypothetical protein HOD67_01500 [Euryarchaeota archaeon]|nr:hypothetical protein [Euryarchaeota archaeon]
MPGVEEQENRGNNISNPPQIPLEILDQLEQQLSRVDAPFLRFLKKNLSTIWLEESDSRLGMTRFECNHHELFRRRRLKVSPGPVTIGLNPILANDDALFCHTLVHELLHAVGLLDHGTTHADLVKKIAPAPKLADSPVLQKMRSAVLENLPERQWICSKCGFSWERRRVSLPSRCPKCASKFTSQ